MLPLVKRHRGARRRFLRAHQLSPRDGRPVTHKLIGLICNLYSRLRPLAACAALSYVLAPTAVAYAQARVSGERLYPLTGDFRFIRDMHFVRLDADHVALSLMSRSTNEISHSIDDFLASRLFTLNDAARLFPGGDGITAQARDQSLGWDTEARGKHQIFVGKGVRVTFVSPLFAGEDGINFHGDYFGDACLDPAATYLRVERQGSTEEEKVLFYVFRDPVPLTPAFRCEEDLFAPPHNSARIIDPVLTAAVLANGTTLLAGASYVAMPDVVEVPAGFELAGDGTKIFIIDKRDVDRIRQTAADEYAAIQRDTVARHNVDPQHVPLPYFSGAGLAALTEQRLLEFLNGGGK